MMTRTTFRAVLYGTMVLAIALLPQTALPDGPPTPINRLIGVVEKDLPPGKPAAEKAWVRCDRWADSRSPETFARDVLRIEAERIACDEDKAVMLYHWVTRCFGRSGASREGEKGLEGGMVDQWKDFHCYGQGLCDRWGRLMGSVFRAAGMPARKVATAAHTMCETYYKDRDGVSRWHWFDAHLGRYVYSPDGSHIMGAEELAKDTAVYFNFTKASVPFGVRSNMPVQPRKPTPAELNRQKRWFAGFVYSKIWQNDFDPRADLPAGASITRYWSRKDGCLYAYQGHKFNEQCCKLGRHDPTPPLYDDGTVKDPFNYPCWKNYLIDCACGLKSVKPNGHAIYRWQPVLTGEDFGKDAWLAENVVADMRSDAPRVHPARAREQATLIYQVGAPHLMAEAKVKARVWRKQDRRLTEVEFYLSTDGGTAWNLVHAVKTPGRPGPFDVEIDLGQAKWQANQPNVYGKHGFLLRVDMLGDTDPADIGLDNLEFEIASPLNMFTLPMLLPGKNVITVEAMRLAAGKELAVTYCWDDPSGKNRLVKKSFKTLPAEFTIEVAGKTPEDVHMRHVGMEVAGADQPRRGGPEPATAPAAAPQPPPRTAAPMIGKPPVIDGAIEEGEWAGATVIDALKSNRTGEVFGSQTRTTVHLARDARNLYVAFHCVQPRSVEMATGTTKRDGEVWKDDSVEVFLCPTGKADQYWHIVANAKGAVLDAFHAEAGKGDTKRNLSVRCAAGLVKSVWTVELAVPLAEAGIDPARGAVRANFCRNLWGSEIGLARPQQEQQFSPTGGSYHKPDRFGFLDFPPAK